MNWKKGNRDYRNKRRSSENYNTVYVEMDVHKESFSLCCCTNEREQSEYCWKTSAHQRLLPAANYRYGAARNHWTQAHLKWMKALKPEDLYQEVLSGYLSAYDQLTDKRKRLDKRIEELAADTDYQENVRKLTCFLGIKIQTALIMVVEVGGFKRFPTAQKFASYLGLVPGRIPAGIPITGLGLQKQEQPCTYVNGRSSTKLYPWDSRQ